MTVPVSSPLGFEDALADASLPATPASGLELFCEDVGGRKILAVTDADGLHYGLQATFARNKIGMWMPPGNSAAVPIATGLIAPSTAGTATSRGLASTNMFTSLRRLGMVSAATAAGHAELRTGQTVAWRGNAAGLGGFAMMFRFGVSDAATVAGARMFLGLQAQLTAMTNVEPNTLLNLIGVCKLSSSTNLMVITNDGTGTATTTDLGANFPAHTLSVDVYECAFYCPPNGTSIGYKIKRLNTGNVATGTITTDLPVNTTFMGITLWRTNNATALAVGFDLNNFYLETDN